MGIVLLTVRILLAIVFVLAGLAKLADRAGSRQALRDFGVAAPLAHPLGTILPLAELTIAIALIPTTFAWWGALAALVLLLLFVGAISYNLARGRTPDCHCFGQLHSAPAGRPTLIRNLVLAALAGFVVYFGRSRAGLSTTDWISALTVAQRLELLAGLILFGLLALEGWVLLQIMSQQGRLLLRLEAVEAQLIANDLVLSPATTGGLAIGTPAPTFRLAPFSPSSHHGETITLDTLRAKGKPIILIFSDPGCGPCTALLPEVGHWQRDYASKLTLALISRGTPEDNHNKTSVHKITQVLLQQDREVAQAYQAYGTPSAVLIRSDGAIGSPLAQGADAIRGLVADAVGLPVLKSLSMAHAANGNSGTAALRQPAGPKVGERATEFTLPDLSGKPKSLADFRGNRTLVLFWNPGCGFCQRMLEDLKAWEAKPPRGAPQLLVVSTGTLEANQALGLRASVLLDEGDGMSIGSKFGAGGTPMAVLIDAEGKIASEVAAGAPAILTLAGTRQDVIAPA